MRHRLGGPKTDGTRLADCENGSFSQTVRNFFQRNLSSGNLRNFLSPSHGRGDRFLSCHGLMPQNVPNRFATKCQKIFTTTCPNQISHKMAPQIQFFQVPGLSDAPRVHRGGVNSTYPSPSSPPPEIEHQYFSSKLFGITFDNGCDS